MVTPRSRLSHVACADRAPLPWKAGKAAALLLLVVALTAGLQACRTPAARLPPPPVGRAAPPAADGHGPSPPAAPATEYRVASERSLLTIRAYRGGALAALGHNHVIASRDLAGSVSLGEDRSRSRCELRLPVAGLTVDEDGLRGLEGPDFAAPVPADAKIATRRNMLSEALLDGARHAAIVLRCERLVRAADGYEVTVGITLKDRSRSVMLPLRVEESAAQLVISGEVTLSQAALGLAPFSVMMGALRVEDDLRVRIRIVAVPAGVDRGQG